MASENAPSYPSPPTQKKHKRNVRCRVEVEEKSEKLVPQLSKATRLKGRLSLLPSLPLDVLFEIFGHLPPLSILVLTRTSKDLRRVLMHKSAISIWKSSLGQIPDLPECPENMPEPAWVNLVYSAHCHNCLENRVQKIDWLLKIRLCEKCIKSGDLLDLENNFDKGITVEKLILRCVAFSTTLRGRKKKCCLVQEKKRFLEELRAVDEEDRSAFAKASKTALAVRVEHAVRCENWADTLAQDRMSELEEIRRQRRDDIVDRLEQLGYIEEIDYLEDLQELHVPTQPALQMFADHPDVKLSKPLTEKSWTTVKPRLVKYMGVVKAHRLAAARLQVVREREQMAVSSWVQFTIKQQYPSDVILPAAVDILSWPKIRAIITLPSETMTKEEETTGGKDRTQEHACDAERAVISPSLFTSIFESLSADISKWQEKKMRQICGLNLVHLSIMFSFCPLSDQMDALRLAACVFACENPIGIHRWIEHYQTTRFYPVMWFPEVLHHACNTVKQRAPLGEEDEPPSPLLKASKAFPHYCRKEWSVDSIFFDEKASRAVKGILEACGMGYMSTTTKQMDEYDFRFICLKCSFGAKSDGQRPRTVMSWRNAVQHCMLVHWGDGSVKWEKIAEESAVEARALSAAHAITSNIWRCAHCRDSVSDRDGHKSGGISVHLATEHKLQSAVVGRDYYKANDCPPPAIASVKIIPKEVTA